MNRKTSVFTNETIFTLIKTINIAREFKELLANYLSVDSWMSSTPAGKVFELLHYATFGICGFEEGHQTEVRCRAYESYSAIPLTFSICTSWYRGGVKLPENKAVRFLLWESETLKMFVDEVLEDMLNFCEGNEELADILCDTTTVLIDSILSSVAGSVIPPSDRESFHDFSAIMSYIEITEDQAAVTFTTSLGGELTEAYEY